MFVEEVRDLVLSSVCFLTTYYYVANNIFLNLFLVLTMKGSTEVKANDFHSPCRHFNFTVAPIVDHLEEHNITCNLKTRTRTSAIVEEDPKEEKSMNHTCRIMEYLNNCTHISLHLEKDVKSMYLRKLEGKRIGYKLK